MGLENWESDCDGDVGRGLLQPGLGSLQTRFLPAVPKLQSQPRSCLAHLQSQNSGLI